MDKNNITNDESGEFIELPDIVKQSKKILNLILKILITYKVVVSLFDIISLLINDKMSILGLFIYISSFIIFYLLLEQIKHSNYVPLMTFLLSIGAIIDMSLSFSSIKNSDSTLFNCLIFAFSTFQLISMIYIYYSKRMNFYRNYMIYNKIK